MYKKRVTRYYAECGKGFWKEEAALDHESRCRCWKNPKNKACQTCSKGTNIVYDGETGEGNYWECADPRKNGHTGAMKKIDYISENCEYWQA